ncbi:acetate kinase [Methylobacterium sp. Leaf456]|uniref:acetate/propionate family kinase n=1 Tax=Methylobacterium sp. Leaf456 TaxID=1736382 RepID=UPI00070086F5|nr:acetate/propionate family kinase [Methylobacterium sp. Leaf456]KQT56157.1 acetate kinase [Methylobacterium sp. Leaf456]
MILILNAGSSSLRCALFRDGQDAAVWRVHVAGIGNALKLTVTGGLDLADDPPPDGDLDAVVGWLMARMLRLPDLRLRAVGHRIVHGGTRHVGPARVDEGLIAELEALAPFAPGHQPQGLACIAAVGGAWPDLPQVACFDTAFHRTQDRLAQIEAIPRGLTEDGLPRFGFHGLSYAHVARMLPRLIGKTAKGRIVVAHLGHGASLCAMADGRSVATTMGLTTLGGLMMGTRSGTVDPGLVLHLIQSRGMTASEVADLLERRSGLLGVSGISDDVRVLEASEAPEAREALDLFAYRIARETGSLAVALGGLDALVFTGGIGENAAAIRADVCGRLACLGLDLDPGRNDRGCTRIERVGATIPILVMPADEEREIAQETEGLVGTRMTASPSPPS